MDGLILKWSVTALYVFVLSLYDVIYLKVLFCVSVLCVVQVTWLFMVAFCCGVSFLEVTGIKCIVCDSKSMWTSFILRVCLFAERVSKKLNSLAFCQVQKWRPGTPKAG